MGKIIFLFFFLLFCMAGFSQRPPYYGMSVPARADYDVRWNVSTNSLPPVLWIYRVIPTKFSPEIISNLMALGSFTEADRTYLNNITNNDSLYFVSQNTSPRESRSLLIYSPWGAVEYFDYKAMHGSPTNLSVGVPEENQLVTLTTNFLPKIGISITNLCRKPDGQPLVWFMKSETEYYPNHQFITNLEERGVFFIRSVDGLQFLGNGARGGGEVHFGNHGKISQLKLSWRNLEHYKSIPSPPPQTIVSWLREGRAFYSPHTQEGEGINWLDVKKITVNSLSACLYGNGRREPQEWVYPTIILHAVVETTATNVDVEIHCPIIYKDNLLK